MRQVTFLLARAQLEVSVSKVGLLALWIGLLMGAGASYSGAGPTGKMTSVSQGTWGGPGILLSIKENSAIIEYDCAHGTIEKGFEADQAGHFRCQGSYEDEKGGSSQATIGSEGAGSSPALQNATLKSARYEGVVNGAEMTLTVSLTETDRPVGTYHLCLGQSPRLHKCR
jgi:hypothetical protein